MHLGQVLVGGLALLLLLVMFRTSTGAMLGWIMRVLANSAIAVMMIFLWNHFLGADGLAVGLNPVTALVSGALGIPGFALILAVRLFAG